MAQVEERTVERKLLLVHAEVQRSRKQDLGRRMLDYYTLFRRATDLTVLPYVVLLYRDSPALGYRTYEETFRGRTIATLTYFQVRLPALNAREYATGSNALARALSSAMRLPKPEEERRSVYRAAVSAILGALRGGEMDEDAAVALCERQLVAVYDLGDGAFDVSIIELGAGVVEVCASHGDTNPGGDDFDDALETAIAGLEAAARGGEREAVAARTESLLDLLYEMDEGGAMIRDFWAIATT